mmetsp:Transcript_269/g.632  ORF Transcript_269/g.632 Transcript_269/m.632 type:complete len:259 (+) Transcript_269:326-1102(+)
MIYRNELGKHALVQWQTDGIMLLDGRIEQALHHAMISHTLDNVPLEAVLRRDASGHEPLDILRVVKHVLHRGMTLVHACGIPREHDPLQHDPVSVRAQHGSVGHKLPPPSPDIILAVNAVVADNRRRVLFPLDLTKHHRRTRRVCHRSKDTPGKVRTATDSSRRRGRVPLELVLVRVQVVLREYRTGLPRPPSASERERIFRFYGCGRRFRFRGFIGRTRQSHVEDRHLVLVGQQRHGLHECVGRQPSECRGRDALEG